MHTRAMDMKGILKGTRELWERMTIYERFEHIIAVVLTLIISILVAVTVLHLMFNIALLFAKGIDLLDHSAFQEIFGMIMTVLIAMEFKHSIIRAIARRDNIIQVKTVILIAILAISRKFIILDLKVVPATVIASMAVSILALGAVYWMMRERDDRLMYTTVTGKTGEGISHGHGGRHEGSGAKRLKRAG